MIGEAARSTSFNESLEYVLNLKSEDCNLTKAERESKFPAVPITEDAPAWEAGRRDRVIGGNMSGENERELNQEFSAIRKLRPDIKNPLLCISIRKAPNDQVTADQWRDIAAKIVEGLGFQGCPYVVIQHRDKDDHIHILASLIRLDGKVVSDSRSYQKIERVMRDVEVKYGLMPVKNSRDSVNRSPTWIERKRFVEAGEITVKMQLQQRITKVLESKPSTTQFINTLRVDHGVKVFPRLDAEGLPTGVAFGYGDVAMSGTTIGHGYTWNKLLKRGLTFSKEDIEAVRRASERAQVERQQSAVEELNFDEEINLAIDNTVGNGVTIDIKAARPEALSQVRMIEPKQPASPRLAITDEVLHSSFQMEGELASLPLPDSAVDSLPASQPVEKLESKPNVENPSVFSRDKDARIPSLRDTQTNAQKREAHMPAVNVEEAAISDVTNTVMRDTAMSPSPDATLTNQKDLQQQSQVPHESLSKIEREKGQPLSADISAETKTTNKPYDSVKSAASSTDKSGENARKNSQDKEPAQSIAGLKLQAQPQQHSEPRLAEIPPSIEKAKPTEAASAIPTTTESKSVKKKIEPTSPRPDPTSKSASHISVINKKDVATPTAEVKKAPRPAGADKPAKRQSILSSLRAVFDTAVKKHDPAVKKQEILDKYSIEREIARKSLSDFGSECMLRSKATLDKHIVNAAQGVKRQVVMEYDVEHVLSRFHSIPNSVKGKNWMDVGKRVTQAEKSTSVWANLGREVGVDAREEMRKERAVVRKAAHSAYEAEHGFAPPELVKQALGRTLDQLEQQPPNPDELNAVKQTDYRLPAKTPSFLPATRLQCLVSVISQQRSGEVHSLNLIQHAEREVVQATPIQQLNVLKQIEPSLFSSALKDNQSLAAYSARK